MTQRINFTKAPPAVVKAMFGLQAAADHSGLEHSLLDAAEVAGVADQWLAYCIEMHFKDAKAEGESDERLHLLNAWRERRSIRRESRRRCCGAKR